MKAKSILSALAVLASTVVPVVAIFAYEAYRTRNLNLTAEIIARAPEKGNFTPRTLSVSAGKKVRLRIRNVDTVTHGFAIPELNIDVGELKAGHVAIVEFVPQAAGSYEFYCTTWCSVHHLQMRGTLNVVPSAD